MLASQPAAAVEERNSRKQPLSDDDVRQMLAEVDTVYVARGKKRREIPAAEATLDDFKGPTGNYRAPMVRSGARLLVGFHPETLEQLLAD